MIRVASQQDTLGGASIPEGTGDIPNTILSDKDIKKKDNKSILLIFFEWMFGVNNKPIKKNKVKKKAIYITIDFMVFWTLKASAITQVTDVKQLMSGFKNRCV